MGGLADPEIQDNIEEYVNDENKIVTYRWLSLTHSINVNSAKQALYTFVITQRNKGGNDDINVTYFVAGLGKTKQGEPIHKCVVVPETHLDLVKSELEPVTSCHVYSVQKSKLKDTTPLHQTDYDIIRENLTSSPSLSSIVCPWAVKQNSKTKSSIIKGNEQPAAKSETVFKKEIKNNSPIKKPTSPNQQTKSASPSKSSSNGITKKKAENKGSIASMFATASKKNEEKKKDPPEDKVEEKKEKQKPNEKKGGVKSFFAAQTKTQSTKSIEEKTTNKKDKPCKKKNDNEDDDLPQKGRRRIKRAGLFDSSSEDEVEEDEPEQVESQENSDAEVQDGNEVANVVENTPPDIKKGKKDKVKEPDAKKKRTDLDDLKNFEKTLKSCTPKEDIEEQTDVKEVISNKSRSEGSRKRKRTRKLVPKHTVDEDGFMVTEKVWESDSTDASDVEEESQNPAKKTDTSSSKPVKVENKPKAPPKKSVAVPAKGKQQSLMSFFKKK